MVRRILIVLAICMALTACGKETYDNSTSGSDDRTYSVSSSSNMARDLDDTERTEGSGQTTKEEVSTDEEMVIGIVDYIEPDPVWEPAPEPEPEEILQNTEVLIDEERTSRETNSDYADDSTDPDSVGDSVWTAETADVAVEPVDVWDLGLQKWGISYTDTTRILKLISYEGYGWSDLSYYVACACWVRATEGYWGYGNIFSAFGEIDTQYGTWMDELGYDEYAIYFLETCYREPTYCKYVNGLMVPSDYIYYEDGIYCWN